MIRLRLKLIFVVSLSLCVAPLCADSLGFEETKPPIATADLHEHSLENNEVAPHGHDEDGDEHVHRHSHGPGQPEHEHGHEHPSPPPTASPFPVLAIQASSLSITEPNHDFYRFHLVKMSVPEDSFIHTVFRPPIAFA